MYKLKQGIMQAKTKANSVLHGLELFVESTSLIVVALMTYLGVTGKVDLTHLNTLGKYVTMGSCVVIAYLGAIQFVKFLDRQ